MTKDEFRTIIREEVQSAVRSALTVTMTIERVRDERTGQPLAVVERKTEEVFLPSVIVQMLPFHEGAMRGFQNDLTRTKRSLDSANTFINRLADVVERQSQINMIGYHASDPE
jgi:hypothetical protein